MSERVIITGATGFIGRTLCRHLAGCGYEVIALTRPGNPRRPELSNIRMVEWDSVSSAGWVEYADGAYAIINLAGENVGIGSWTAEKKSQILGSRLHAIDAVLEAVEQAPRRPRLIIQASAIGYYGSRDEQILDEQSAPGQGFLAEVCRQCEKKTARFFDFPIRCAIIRLAAVLGPTGGILNQLIPLFRKFLGGCPGSGQQWFSWIHLADAIGAIDFIMKNETIQGALNLAAPHPVQAREFYTSLGQALHRPSLLPIPALTLKLLLGDKARELILASQRVLPHRLLEAGFAFRFPDIRETLLDCIEPSKIQENSL